MTNTPVVETAKFLAAFESFLGKCQKIVDDYFAQHYANLKPPRLVTEPGKRYIRIVAEDVDGPQRSAWAFVDTTNGDILKPDGWKRPAKHARGNIFAENPTEHVSRYGPAYLK